MQQTLKVENTPTNHRREHNVLGKTQASFRLNFKVTSNKIGKEGHLQQCSKDIMRSGIYYKLQITN